MKPGQETNSQLNAIGERIQSIEDRLGLSQLNFARQLGVSQSFLSQVEAGKRKPSFELLFSLHTRFKVELPWVLTGTGEMFSQRGREPAFAELFPGVPLEEDVLDLVKSLAVPIMKNALVEKYLFYRKRYEDIIVDYVAGKKSGSTGQQ